jgi:hypothetical protein
VFFVEQGSFQIVQYTPDEFFALQQFSRNCGVRLQSERTVIFVRGVGRDQFTDARAEWGRPAEYLLREARQMIGRFRVESEHVPDLRIFCSAFPHSVDYGLPGRRLSAPLDIRKKHWLHSGTALYVVVVHYSVFEFIAASQDSSAVTGPEEWIQDPRHCPAP